MSFDDVLVGIVVGGIALTALYIKSEYVLWRERATAERQRIEILGRLHIARLSRQTGDTGVAQLQSFAQTEAAGSEDLPKQRRSAA